MRIEDLKILDRFMETYEINAEQIIKTLTALSNIFDIWGDYDIHDEAYELMLKRLGISDDESNGDDPSEEDYAAALIKVTEMNNYE